MIHQPYDWASASRSETGKVRQCNEDAFFDAPDLGLWVVADGMGGHAVGDYASRLIVQRIAAAPSTIDLDTLIRVSTDILLDVNRELRREASDRDVGVIGSTVAVLLAHGRECACLWAGDSRIYQSRRGALTQLTRDHNRVEDMVAAGIMDRAVANTVPPSNEITRAVGAADTLDLECRTLKIEDGDTFLLCSDGLYGEVTETEIATELLRGTCDRSCKRLIDLVMSRDARDNITAIVAHAEDPHHCDKTLVNPVLPWGNKR
ncbi:MAG: protein phosphatase 2C domain-containing protein [Pseudomonadota bacterium]|nr:protein phosphatase 2C domain-containing protein [Pseudomonadota bacterium]